MTNNEVSLVSKETQSKVENALKSIEAIVVKNDEDAEKTTVFIKDIVTARKMVEQEKEEYVTPAKQIISKAKDVYDPIINNLKAGEQTVRSKVTAYIVEQEKKNKEKQEKIAADAESGKISESTAIKKLDKVGDVKSSVKTGSTSFFVTRRKGVEIVDKNLIPDEYWIVDEVRLRKVAIAMAGDDKDTWDKLIPGVKVVEITSSQLR